MNRTIKFRVWSEYTNSMCYPENFGFDYWGKAFGWSCEDILDLGCINKRPYHPENGLALMQFTGLLDCEGKEIYEHDIVNVNLFGEQMTCVVLWRNDFYCYAYLPIEYAKESLEGWGDAFESKLTYHDEVTVLGNIYEHSNLLNN